MKIDSGAVKSTWIGRVRRARVAMLALLIALPACLTAQVSVTISPSLVTMATLATQSFTATVAGSTVPQPATA